MTYRILVATNLAEEGLHLLRSEVGGLAQVVDPTQLSQLSTLATADALIIRDEVQVNQALMDAAPKLKVIGRVGVDIAGIDIESATRRGIVVMNTPGVNAISVAEYTFTLMLSLVRQVVKAHQSLGEGQWVRDKFIGSELYNKTLGIIGLGRVGREVAKRALAFGMNVLAVDPFVSESQIERLHVKLVGLTDLLQNADIVTLHSATTSQTTNLINMDTLSQMKPNALLINIAHGSMIDEQAVLTMLNNGRLGGVALDVYTKEPATQSPLINHPKVLHTPHVGDNTREALRDMGIRIARQVLDALRGDDYQHAVNLPFIDGQPFEYIAPYLKLAEKIGMLAHHLAEAAIQRVMVEFRGKEYTDLVKPTTVALLKGLLTPLLGAEQVNYINAPVLAHERKIFVTQTKGLQVINYKNLISCQFEWGGGQVVIAGALFNRTDPHIVQINQYRTDFRPEGVLVIMGSYDVPGVIGRVGRLMGENQINIASWQTGRAEPGGHTLSILMLDEPMDDSILETLRQQDYIRHARQIIL